MKSSLLEVFKIQYFNRTLSINSRNPWLHNMAKLRISFEVMSAQICLLKRKELKHLPHNVIFNDQVQNETMSLICTKKLVLFVLKTIVYYAVFRSNWTLFCWTFWKMIVTVKIIKTFSSGFLSLTAVQLENCFGLRLPIIFTFDCPRQFP